jgi:small nuclear ribonucleoprotein (snRNP)-like protein
MVIPSLNGCKMNYTWLVEKYLEGELSGEELRRFELEILRKPEVAEEVERIRSLSRFMENQHQIMKGAAGLLEDFDDYENIVDENEISRDLENLKVRKISSSLDHTARFRTRIMESKARETLVRHRSNRMIIRKTSVWFAAALMAGVIAVSAWFLTGSNQTDFTSLYEQYYVHRSAEVTRDANRITEDPFNEAMRAYNDADFNRAFQILDGIQEEGIGNKYYLYFGLTAMELGKYSRAIELFNKLEGDEVLEQDGMWYKSLCYLKLEDENASRETLTKIIRNNGYYKRMALALRRKI